MPELLGGVIPVDGFGPSSWPLEDGVITTSTALRPHGALPNEYMMIDWQLLLVREKHKRSTRGNDRAVARTQLKNE